VLTLVRPTIALLLAACTVGPDYKKPDAPVPASYKELGGWKPSEPQDLASRGNWWSVYGNPVLDALEAQVDVSNQTLKANEAAYRQAVAALQLANASFFPVLTAGAAGQRARSSGGTRSSFGPVVANQFSSSLGASWDIDVWGKVRRAVEGAGATAQANAADLAAARLSAQAALASDYFTLRAEDELKRLLDATAAGYAQSLQITKNQYASGVAARSDVVQAQTQLDQTRAQAIATGVQRAQLEHAIAVLIGKPPAEFSIAPVVGLPPLPSVPVGVPSALLERRPDIAAAERRMAAANAQIGVAVSAYYPTLSLTGSYGFASTMLDQLFKASNAVWSVGPQLAETLYDAGARSAQIEEARAAYDQDVATYRQTVLAGFQEVEDQLASLRVLADQAEVQAKAVASAAEAEQLVLNQYKAGTVAYTSVVTAQATTLLNRQTALSIEQNRLTASAALIQALGGGWESSQLPTLAGE
jgi:NodT family efflux transporter outer membrane factor (OMF) lipoprotein